MDKFVISQTAYDKIMYYVNKCPKEISGLGVVENMGGVLTVTDIVLLKQECTSTETDLDAEAIATAEYEHHKSGKAGELRFWWHSHVNMDVFWSGTDKTAMAELSEHGWFIHGVFNKRGEVRCAYTANKPLKIFVDDITLEIDDEIYPNEEVKGWNETRLTLEAEMKAKIDAISLEYKPMFAQVDAEIKDVTTGNLDAEYTEKVTLKTYVPKVWSGSNYYDLPRKRWSASQGKLVDIEDVPRDKKKETREAKIQKSVEEQIIALNEQIVGEISLEPEYLTGFEHLTTAQIDGYWELITQGYSDNEIEKLNDFKIYDLEDITAYEVHIGSINMILGRA